MSEKPKILVVGSCSSRVSTRMAFLAPLWQVGRLLMFCLLVRFPLCRYGMLIRGQSTS